MTSAAASIVFVVDDDDLVRASIQGMLKSVGLYSETFGRRKSSYVRTGQTGQAAWFWT